MRSITIAALLLVSFSYFDNPVHAQTAESCKTCRDYNVACLRSHSAAACKAEYEVCMKRCRKK